MWNSPSGFLRASRSAFAHVHTLVGTHTQTHTGGRGAGRTEVEPSNSRLTDTREREREAATHSLTFTSLSLERRFAELRSASSLFLSLLRIRQTWAWSGFFKGEITKNRLALFSEVLALFRATISGSIKRVGSIKLSSVY